MELVEKKKFYKLTFEIQEGTILTETKKILIDNKEIIFEPNDVCLIMNGQYVFIKRDEFDRHWKELKEADHREVFDTIPCEKRIEQIATIST